MKRSSFGTLLLAFALTACTINTPAPSVRNPTPTYAIDRVGEKSFIRGQLIVGYREGTSPEAIARHLGATVQQDWPLLRAALLQLPPHLSAPKAQASAERLRGVRYAELNLVQFRPKPTAQGVATTHLAPTQASVSDPDFDKQWMHRQMNSLAAWRQGVSGSGIRIGIHDDFIDHRHPDLVDNMFYPGFDGFAASNPEVPLEAALITPETPHDGIGFHGTSVAGTAAAVGNDLGGRGTAYGASIVPLAINEPEQGGLVLSAIVNAALFAVLGPDFAPGGDDRAPGTDPETGPYVHIVNMSWGGALYSQIVKDTMDLMLASGIILVTSAGNTPTEGPSFPAWNPGLINVAATTARGTRTSFSNRGLHLDLAAPGENVWTTATRGCIFATPDGSSCSEEEPEVAYTYINGTSFSSPAAAGAAALVLEASAERDAEGNITSVLSAAQVRQILTETATRPSGYDRSALGAGIVNSAAAVARALELAENPVPGGGSLLVEVVWSQDPNVRIPQVGLTLIPEDTDAAVKYTQTSDGTLLIPLGTGLFQQMDAGRYTLQASGPYTSLYGGRAATAETTVELLPGEVTAVQLELDVTPFDDPFEPNNSLSEAAELGEVGITVRATLYDPEADSDVDVYSIPVEAGQLYRASLKPATGNFEPAISVYDASGSLLAQSGPSQRFTLNPFVEFEAPEDGVAYIEVAETSGLEIGNSPFNLYDLDIAPYIGEEEEPNGSAVVVGTSIQNIDFTDAQHIPLGSALDAELTEGDTDIFQVEVPAGETLVADTVTAVDGEPDTILGIYDEAGQQVAFNDNYNGLSSRAFYTTQAGGTYYVVVAPWDAINPANATTGEYGLMVTRFVNPPTE
jgi:serine protease